MITDPNRIVIRIDKTEKTLKAAKTAHQVATDPFSNIKAKTKKWFTSEAVLI